MSGASGSNVVKVLILDAEKLIHLSLKYSCILFLRVALIEFQVKKSSGADPIRDFKAPPNLVISYCLC